MMFDDNNNNHDPRLPSLSLLVERQRQMLKRLDLLEKRHEAVETMINRYIGGIALLVAAGVFVGWLFTIKSHF